MATNVPLQPYAEAHENATGPGDHRPTAQQIIDSEGLVGRWSDKTVLITGASSGIGLETAKALHTTGARVFITVRDASKADSSIKFITKDSPSALPVEVVFMSLDSLESVKAAAEDFLRRSSSLNVLINNAGIMAAPFEKTKDGFESHFGVNHLAHFLLTKLLLPTLVDSSTPDFASRVINVSSSGHIWHNPSGLTPEVQADLNFEKTEYNPWLAYGRSKTANVLHANHIDALFGSFANSDSGGAVHAWSLHPGGITTPLWKHQNESIQERVRKFPARWKEPAQGASTTVWCAVAKALEGRESPLRYCEDCGEAGPLQADAPLGTPGYAAWTYDDTAAEELWERSEALVAPWLQ